MSPARQAWLRLRRNLGAMLGLMVVAVVGLTVLGAPWLVTIAPDVQRNWIGAQPPGFSHPDVRQENLFAVGQPVECGAGCADMAVLELDLIRRQQQEYRVALRRGVVGSLQQTEGAVRLEELRLPGPGWRWRKKSEHGTAEIAGDLVIRSGQTPPAGLFATGESGPLLLLAEGPAHHSSARIAIVGGVVSRIEVDGTQLQKLALQGADIAALRGAEAEGRPLLELTLWHPLGTDASGRDVWARILYGGRISLLVGLVATAVSGVIGVLYGAWSGWLGGAWDRWLMNAVDVLYGLPFMFLVILLLVNFGRDLVVLFIALGAVQWLTMARIVRAQVLALKNREFIAAAQLSGSRPQSILLGHLLPNCLGPIIIYSTLTVPMVILEESFLAFIGLQVQWDGLDVDSWGALVKYGVDHPQHGWLLLWPSLAMCGTLLALNALGNGLRDALDPRLQRGA